MTQQRVSLHTECSLAYIMANPKIKVKRSSVEGKVPAVTQLERGELAVNSYDGKVYILKDQFSVGIATTTHTLNPWNEPNGVGAGVSYSGNVKVLGQMTIGNYNMPTTLGAQDTVLKSNGTNVVFGSAAAVTATEEAFTATQGQTVFTASSSLPTYIQVFVNGIKIRPTADFSKSGTQLTLVSGAIAGDEIDIVRFD